jgi:hypothetical protein
MTTNWKRLAAGLTLALTLCVFGLISGYAGEQGGLEGWEKNSGYNNLFDLAQKDKVKGVVVDIKTITPFPGMAPGVGLIVRSAKDGEVPVHLGPRSFLNLNYLWNMKGADVKVRGVWADINGKTVFIAAKIKSKSQVLKLRRTRDGRPLWTMTPKDLAMERTLE